jgi:hypothetical protein
MAVIQLSRQKRRKRPIKCIFKFHHRPCVVAYCYTTEEIVAAFNEAKGAA